MPELINLLIEIQLLFVFIFTCGLPHFWRKHRYNALSDVVLENGRLCMAAILHEQFIKEHPETADIIMSNYSSQSSYELLAALEDNSCDAIVLSSTEFVAAGRLDSEYCSSAAILRDNILFNVDIIIPFGGIDDHGNRYNTSSDRFGYDATIAHFNRMVKYRCKLTLCNG